MIKIRLEQLVNSAPALTNFFEQRVPLNYSFRFKGFAKTIEMHLQDFNAARLEYVKELGEQIEGDTYKIKEENLEEYKAGIQKLLDEELELDTEVISIRELPKVELSVNDVLRLDWLLTE